MYFFQKYIPENTFSKCAYAFNTRQSWLNFSKPHLQDCCMMNLNNFSIIGNNVNGEISYERTCLFILKVLFFLFFLACFLAFSESSGFTVCNIKIY